MNYRLNSKIIALVAVFVLIAGALFAYTLLLAPTDEVPHPQTEERKGAVQERLLTAKHRYENGVHTVAGSVALPTPCHAVVAEPFFVDSGTTTVEIRFSTTLSGDVCAQVVTQAPFKVTFTAGEQVAIRATWDGAPVRLNLVPAVPGENLDGTVEIKG